MVSRDSLFPHAEQRDCLVQILVEGIFLGTVSICSSSSSFFGVFAPMKVGVDYITFFLFWLFVDGSGIQARFCFLWTTGGKEWRALYLCILIRRVSVAPLCFWFAYHFHLPFSFVSLCFPAKFRYLRFSFLVSPFFLWLIPFIFGCDALGSTDVCLSLLVYLEGFMGRTLFSSFVE